MFGKWLSGRHDRPVAENENLNELLREWRGIEPAPQFEKAVWQRIQLASGQAQRNIPSATPLANRFIPQFTWVNVLAAAAGIVLGLGMAFNTTSSTHNRNTEATLLHRQTLSGSYLTMVTGGPR